MANFEETQSIWCEADAVCFDVDSTVCTDEAIDELANYCGVGRQVAECTKAAMGGAMSFRTALTRRLNIIRPSRDQLASFMIDHPPNLTPGVRELVQLLQSRNVPIYLISGGFQSVIECAAEELEIPTSHIHANRLRFFMNGEYAGFDETQPTSESGGKAAVIKRLKDKCGYRKLVMIGDGATDLEACPPADAFIGFGGNVVREKVQTKAKWYVTDFEELISTLENGPSQEIDH